MPGAGLLVSLYWASFFKTEACVVRPPFGAEARTCPPKSSQGR